MNIANIPQTYTPQQVAEVLQLSTATIYSLIDKGELAAKKYGKAYRIAQTELSFALTGLDTDILQAQKQDLLKIDQVQAELKKARKSL